jgi:hypothetical protein
MSNVRLHDSSSFDVLFATNQSIEGILKALVIVTKKSRFLWVQSMAAMSEVPTLLEDYFTEVGIPDRLKSDNALENCSLKVKTICRRYAIRQAFSEVDHQHQNHVERWIGYLKRQAYRVLQESGAPPTEWWAAIEYVVSCHNKTA